MKRLNPLTLLLFLSVVACSDGPSGPQPVLSVQLSHNDQTLMVGETLQLTATTLGSGSDTLRGRPITWSSSDNTVATVTPSGLVQGIAPGQATIRAKSENAADSVRITVSAPFVSCMNTGQSLNLAVGEVFTATGVEAQSLCISGGAPGSEYTYVPFFASSAGSARLALEIAATGVQPASGPPNPYLAPSLAREWLAEDRPTVGDGGFHHRLREREIRELTPLVPAARAAITGSRASGGALFNLGALMPPKVGDLLTLNAQANSACSNPQNRIGRVAAVTERAIVVVDTANPKGGDISDEEYRSFALAFDTLIYPVNVENFGAPSDIDANGKVTIFYTRAVNELTPENADYVIGGFFFARDLFPRERQPGFEACATSNQSEIFYLLAPDPNGEVNGNKRSVDQVRRSTVGVIGHEFQHLINASRRLYELKTQNWNEEVWLNEGLSHIAEELAFYRASRLAPRQNLTIENVRSTEQIRTAFNLYQASNFGRFISYLQDPDTASLMGSDNLPTRGAVWAFLRYAADRKDGPDQPLWFNLVNSTTTGVTNLRNVLGVNPIDWMQDWTVSVYTDDAVPAVQPRFMQPSWNFRNIMSAITSTGNRYPLKTTPLVSGASPTGLSLYGGGAAFLRFGVGPSGRAEVRITSGGVTPSSSLRVSVVRTR